MPNEVASSAEAEAEAEARLRPALLEAARTLAIDRVTAEVVGAMEAAGIATIVLKGRSIASWLYPSGGRAYRDTDLLVPASEFARAEDVLRSLGFVDLREGFSAFERREMTDRAASCFVRSAADRRGPADLVDLHRNLPGWPTPDDLMWTTFSADTEQLSIGGADIRVLGHTALALHIVIHAAQHSFDAHTTEDLRRAVSALPPEEWSAVADLARRLGVEDILGWGLSHEDAGTAIANRLALPTQLPNSAFWFLRQAPLGRASLAEVRAAPTWRLKFSWIRWTLAPSTSRLRYLYRIANPTPRAMAAGYIRRWQEVAASLAPAARAAARHRKQ